MNSKGKIEKWLLNDWSSGCNNLEALKSNNDVITEDSDRKNNDQAAEGENKNLNKVLEEGKDFSPSASSWEPSDGSSSSDDSDTEAAQSKTLKMEQYIRHYAKRRNGKNIPTPIHRPNAVVKVLQERQAFENNKGINDSRKRKFQESLATYKNQPDSTRKNYSPSKDTVNETISNNKKEILQIKASFEELFKMLNDMKPLEQRRNYVDTKNVQEDLILVNKRQPSHVNEVIHNASYHSEHSERSQSEESNRSDDNVLITNKYHKARVSPDNQQQDDSHKENEWVPIGSGKTLIHKDKYRKVNWKSYTIATRTLLLATFPRRILATHSLTGKRSPAFQNKPAKMCLDPKIVSDIIIEITSKFKVKENLVRGIITTKCADECKMLKMRLKNKNIPIKGINVPSQRKLKEESKEGQ